MTSDLRETRLALPVHRPAKWLVRTLVCQPDRQGFIDTHVLVYAEASDVPVKQQAALTLLQRLYETGTGVLSTQVLQE